MTEQKRTFYFMMNVYGPVGMEFRDKSVKNFTRHIQASSKEEALEKAFADAAETAPETYEVLPLRKIAEIAASSQDKFKVVCDEPETGDYAARLIVKPNPENKRERYRVNVDMVWGVAQ